MGKLKYTLTCPYCNEKHEIQIDERLLSTFQTIDKCKNMGVECARCGKTIPLTRRNMKRNFTL